MAALVPNKGALPLPRVDPCCVTRATTKRLANPPPLLSPVIPAERLCHTTINSQHHAPTRFHLKSAACCQARCSLTFCRVRMWLVFALSYATRVGKHLSFFELMNSCNLQKKKTITSCHA
jgi:hypothetical protein